MPNCFSLTRKSGGGPVSLTQIDEEMCRHFGVACHPTKWYHYWYDTIGFDLACGGTFAKMRAKLIEQISEDDPESEWDKRTLEIVDWLDANFESDAWARIGK